MFQSGDWIKIKYGEYAGKTGKVAVHRMDGSYGVILYDDFNALKAPEMSESTEGKSPLVMLSEAAMDLIEPFVISQKQLKEMARAEKTYEDYAEKVFPQFNIKAEKKYTMTVNDIKSALVRINKNKQPLPLFKQWFWMILNVFYEDLNIASKFDENVFSDFPKDEKEIFSTAFGITEKLYWRLEERFGRREEDEQYLVQFENEPVWDLPNEEKQGLEVSAYLAVCGDIIERIDSYNFCKGKPQGAWIYSPSQMRHVVASYEKDEDLKQATPESRALFKDFVKKLYHLGDPQAIRILAWSHYEGNICYRQNWNKSKKYLLELFEKVGDPAAANSLGYIYYYGRCNDGVPQYEEAFKYFSYAALDGIDESIFMVADMLIYGQGVRKNVDMGMEMLVNGYRQTSEDMCRSVFESRFAEYAMRMGDACRNGLIYGLGNRDAYRFYLESKFALGKRRPFKYFGDDVILAEVDRKLALMREELKIDYDRSELKADYPIFINQMYEDRFPVKVSITKKRGSKDPVLKLSRFRFSDVLSTFKVFGELPEGMREKEDEASKILVTYPELSYCNVVSEIEFRLENGEVLKMPETPNNSFLSDGFRKNETTGALEFYTNGELTAAIEADWYVIKVKK
ncbi:MAG: hypothetical protein MJ092_03475 [Lachnospiraceae bacterium]|nr:hypothetical protein [Lachnospiraceae bacterium]